MLETGQDALAGSGREALPLPGTKETAMFASHLIGPAAQMACDDPLAAVNHERRLALAQPATAARRPRRGRHVPARQAVSLLRGGRALLTGLTTNLVDIRRLSAYGRPPQSTTGAPPCPAPHMDPGWRHGETPVVATAQHPGAVVMVSAHTVIEFGLMHHQELQAENQQVRRAMAAPAPFPAFPGVVRRARSWLSVVMVRLGTWRQGEGQQLDLRGAAVDADAA